MSIEFLVSTFDKVSYLQNLLVARATGNAADPNEYLHLRRELLSDPAMSAALPAFVRQHGSLDTFWTWIKGKYQTYSERRTFLSEQFTPLLDSLEFSPPSRPTPPPLTLPHVLVLAHVEPFLPLASRITSSSVPSSTRPRLFPPLQHLRLDPDFGGVFSPDEQAMSSRLPPTRDPTAHSIWS